MLRHAFLMPMLLVYNYISPSSSMPAVSLPALLPGVEQSSYDRGTWEAFLQNLPVYQQPVVDYTGRLVANQQKAAGVLSFDVGQRDLQQCADALMRLRAEYLFKHNRLSEISFRFTSGHPYSFTSFCAGRIPRIYKNTVTFTQRSSSAPSAANLRRYLDIVYAYAGTISLHRDLKRASSFKVGTIIITPGSPGHCCIIVDEAVNNMGEKVFKLAESYTPAQSIYILRNGTGPWHSLKEGTITTASYQFTNYDLRSFE